ncbi:MAG TPA: hypothetical protein PLO63_02215 [Syntrophales bacterium]|nr:hypothetical protein [Syntrophales bacterium]
MQSGGSDTISRSNYTPILRVKDGSYCFFILELNILAEGPSIQEAYDLLETRKKDYFEKTKYYGLENTVENPVPLRIGRLLSHDLSIFFIKTLIVALVLFLLTLAFLPVFSSVVRHEISAIGESINKVSARAVLNMPGRINEALTQMPDEEKKVLVGEWGRLSLNMRQIADQTGRSPEGQKLRR